MLGFALTGGWWPAGSILDWPDKKVVLSLITGNSCGQAVKKHHLLIIDE
jgi:hypothetical protein